MMYIGIDIGTSGARAVVLDQAGRLLASAEAAVPLRAGPTGQAEQDVDEAWRSILSVLRRLGEQVDTGLVQGIGLSCHGGAIMFRHGGECLAPAITWRDGRGAPYDAQFMRTHGAPWLRPRVGRGQSGFAIGQLLRLQEEDAAALRWPRQLSFVGDLLTYRLSGRAACDSGLPTLAMLYNPTQRRIDHELLVLLGLRPDQLPDILPARQPAGGLTRAVAEATGLRPGIPVAPAILDHFACALGCGALGAGDVLLRTGRVWTALVSLNSCLSPTERQAWLCQHLAPSVWAHLLPLVQFQREFELGGEAAGAPDAGPGSAAAADRQRNSLARLGKELVRLGREYKKAKAPLGRLIVAEGLAHRPEMVEVLRQSQPLPVVACTSSLPAAGGAAILARAMLETHLPLEALAVGGQ